MASSQTHFGAWLPIFKTIGWVMVALLILALVLFVAGGLYRTYVTEHRGNQKTFVGGTVPEPLPDGFYAGKPFKGFDWQGKIFNRNQQTGVNRFSSGERYVFKTYPAAGLRDKNVQVLRIDYNQPGNPWWLHFIVDEIVQVSPGHYLGKVHLKIIPGLTFTLTYFELAKS